MVFVKIDVCSLRVRIARLSWYTLKVVRNKINRNTTTLYESNCFVYCIPDEKKYDLKVLNDDKNIRKEFAVDERGTQIDDYWTAT